MQGVLLGCCQGMLHALVPRPRETAVRRQEVPVRLARYDTDEASARRAGPERKTMAITPGTMTLDEFLARYEHDPVLEYERGVVTEKMPPALGHGFLAGLLVYWLNSFMVPRKLGIAASELRITDQVT